MRTDAQLLGDVPDHIQFDALLKARPSTEGEKRFLYLEASNEGLDHQNEITLQKALMDSAEYYLRHGNLDIGHYTVLGPRSGVPNFLDFEIGRPVDVRVSGKTTFVKSELFRQIPGKPMSPQVVNANMVWDSMTAQDPPMRWFPSVGGAVLAKAIQFDPTTKQNVPVITKVRWNNIALDRCPVNKTVGEASTMPVGIFAKSLGGALVMRDAPLAKMLTMGYGTDSATFTGGRSLAEQSLDGVVKTPLFDGFCDALAKAIQNGRVACVNAAGLRDYAINEMGVNEKKAAGLVHGFMTNLRSLTKKESA